MKAVFSRKAIAAFAIAALLCLAARSWADDGGAGNAASVSNTVSIKPLQIYYFWGDG